MVKYKILIYKVLHSVTPWSDMFGIIKSLFFPKNVFVNYDIKVANAGNIRANGIFLAGIGSNKIGLDTTAKGCIRLGEASLLEVGTNVRMAKDVRCYINGHLTIGDDTYIQPNANLVVNSRVAIGSNCAISWNFNLMDDDLHSIIIDGEKQASLKNITIGNHVWVGSNVTILKGASIGNNSVVAAGSVVNGIFPDHVLIGGIPAKIIKNNVNWD